MRCSHIDERLLIRVRDILGRRIFVYGKGTGFDTLKTFVFGKYDIQISGVIDRKYEKPVVSSSTLHADLAHYIDEKILRDGDVIVVSLGSKKFYANLKKDLEGKTDALVVWALDILEYHLSHAEPNFLDGADEFLRINGPLINAMRGIYEDEKSRLIFDGVMKYFSGNNIRTKPIPSDPLATQYFPSDFTLPLGNSRFINGGAYDGDTLRSMIENLGSLGEITVCFEPDLFNFKRLTNNVRKLCASSDNRVICLPLGLGDLSRKVSFRGGTSVNSSIDPAGSEQLTVVSIDETLPNFKPTFINMDIEGAEEQALRGAIETIKISKPDLAICVYHSPQQFLAVPSFLADLDLGYKFRLRNYTGFPAETVLYATASDFVN
jgi:FkbM family methyltransferase